MRDAPSNGPAIRREAPALWRYALLAVLGAVILVYTRGLDAPFVLDDQGAIVNNPAIRRLWPLTAALNPPPAEISFYTRPFTGLTMCWDYAWWGLQPRGFHLTSLALHLLNVLALYALARRTFRAGWPDPTGAAAEGLALAVALLWGVHPLNTAAVNYLTQRGELLITLFSLLTLYAVNRAAGAPTGRSTRWQVAAVAACLLGMGSKESMLAVPLLALVYDRVFLAGSWREVVRRRGVMYLGLFLTLAWPVARHVAYSPHIQEDLLSGHTRRDYLLTQCWGLTHLFRLAFWPRPLVFYYGRDLIFTARQVWPQAAVLAVLAGLTILTLWRRPRWGFWGLACFALLAPSSSLVPILGQPVAEHRMYAPLAFLVLLVVAGFYAVAAAPGTRRRASQAGTMLFLAAGLALLLGWLTAQRLRDYRDLVSLWQDTVNKCPWNARARSDLGAALAATGLWEEAVEEYQAALRLKPDDPDALNNLGVAMRALGQPQQAGELFGAALNVRSNLVPGHVNLGGLRADQGRYDEARVHFAAALQAMPGRADLYVKCGDMDLALGRKERAIEQYREALRLDPHDPEAHQNLGVALIADGQPAAAVASLREALRLRPGYLRAQVNLGQALYELGRYVEAENCFREVLHGGRATAQDRFNLACALLRLGRTIEAYEYLDQDVDAADQPARALRETAWKLERRDLPADAAAYLRRALVLQPGDAQAQTAMARLLATATNAALRDPAEALRLARQADAAQPSDPETLDALAAAQAAAGQWAAAAATLERAIAQAAALGQDTFAQRCRTRLALYRQGGAPAATNDSR